MVALGLYPLNFGCEVLEPLLEIHALLMLRMFLLLVIALQLCNELRMRQLLHPNIVVDPRNQLDLAGLQLFQLPRQLLLEQFEVAPSDGALFPKLHHQLIV